MNVAIFTSTEQRHRFVVNYLSASLPVTVVVLEPKQFHPASVGTSEVESAVVRAYFTERDRSEVDILPEGREISVPANCEVIRVQPGEINQPGIVDAVRRTNVSIGIVFGTGVIRPPVLGSLRLLNIHLGVSPHYRGSGTNFWAMYNGDFHLAGATLHYLDDGIDSGPIICHVTSDPSLEDTPHTLGNRIIRRAAEQAVDVVRTLMVRDVPGIPQWQVASSNVCRRVAFTPSVLESFLQKWQNGLIADYLSRELELKQSVRLITWEDRLHSLGNIPT